MKRSSYARGLWYVTFPSLVRPQRQPTVGPFATSDTAHTWLNSARDFEGGYAWRYFGDSPLPLSISAFRPIPPCIASKMVQDGRQGVVSPIQPSDATLAMRKSA
jgi:hypothetical protein